MLYILQKATITNVESEIVELPSVFCITAHPNLFNLNEIVTINLLIEE